jgi:hypothetical protein
MKRILMKWPWPVPGMRDILGIVALVALVGLFAVVHVGFPNVGVVSNHGFDPEWDCSNVARGGAVCTKKPPAPETP